MICRDLAVISRHLAVTLLVLAALPDDALVPLCVNVVLGLSMHDKEAAAALGISKGSRLAAVNGVGGGLWDESRRAAWLTDDYPLVDAVMLGANHLSLKKDIAQAYSYEDFAEMVLSEVDTLQAVVDDLPADGDPGEEVVYDIRLDVASSAFLFVWASVLGLAVPSLIGKTTDDVRQLVLHNDYFAECPKLVTALLYVKADGGFGDDPRWQLCIVGVVVLMRVVCGRSGRVRYVERVYELPQPFKGSRQAHGSGSHLFQGLLPRALAGHEDELEPSVVSCALRAEMERRRNDTRIALEKVARGMTMEAAGATELDVEALERVRFAEAAEEYDERRIFEAWASKNGITHSLLDAATLRAGFDEHVRKHVTGEGAACSAVGARLIARQRETDAEPPRVGARPAAAAREQEEAAAALEEERVPLEEMLLLTGKRIEVNYLAEGEDEEGEGEWWAGKVKGATRRRGLNVLFDPRGARQAEDAWLHDIGVETEGTLWRLEA